ncbi:MAG: bifunctional 4-hydroxy-2-oxoglutarate aldolase/2-dehydro-3-deoxy-phosphogluconate aldolase [Verrucomicrobia bacterium]|nr:bifunctional 4-hydroxy-2-oxoglutarate aldolase/2-dehydro-3-deoxy-phosphogluconate aldolase [Verrucomicrobiota bacterium]
MKPRSEILRQIVHPGVIAVIRADSSSQLLHVAGALKNGGIAAMEVTMTTPDALEVIRAVNAQFRDEILIGVGTVLDAETCRMALLAGASFVVTPALKKDVIQSCRRYGAPVICGAYTPTEILTAWEAGADFVKVFPADSLGPGYIKAVKAPLPQIEIIPTGGVDLHTAGDFIRAGCAAVAAGSSLVSRKILDSKNWAELTSTAAKFAAAVAQARRSLA